MKKLKNDKVLRAITIGISAMIAATSMPLEVLAAGEGDNSTTTTDPDTENKTESNVTASTATESAKNEADIIVEKTVPETEEAVSGVVTEDFTKSVEVIKEIILVNTNVTNSLEESNAVDAIVADKEVIDEVTSEPTTNDEQTTESIEASSEESTEASTDESAGTANVESTGTGTESNATDNKNVNDHIEDAKSDIKAVEGNLEAAVSAETSSNEALEALEGNDGLAQQLVDEANNMNAANDKADEAIDAANTTISSATTEAVAQEAYDDAEKAVQEAEKEYKTAEENYNSVKEEYDAAQEKLAKAEADYTKALEDANINSSAAKKDLEKATADLEKAQQAANDISAQLEVAKNAAEDAEKQLIASKESAYENAKSDYAKASIENLKLQDNKDLWDERDKVFKEIVEGYYVANILSPGATNVTVENRKEGIGKADNTSKYFVRYDGADYTKNYATVTYTDKDGKQQTVYLNYTVNEKSPKKEFTIFQKTEETID